MRWFWCLIRGCDIEYVGRTEWDIDDDFFQCNSCGKCWDPKSYLRR